MAAQKKKFFPVEVPLVDEELELRALNSEDLKGRFIKLDLSRSLRGKGVEVSFEVFFDDKSKSHIALPMKCKLLPYFIRRMMRKRVSYVEDSLILDTKDVGVQVKVKPFLITRKRVSRAVRNALREASEAYLKEYVKSRSTEDLFQEVIFGRMQKPMSLNMKKVYPLSFCDIRHLQIVKKQEE